MEIEENLDYLDVDLAIVAKNQATNPALATAYEVEACRNLQVLLGKLAWAMRKKLFENYG